MSVEDMELLFKLWVLGIISQGIFAYIICKYLGYHIANLNQRPTEKEGE